MVITKMKEDSNDSHFGQSHLTQDHCVDPAFSTPCLERNCSTLALKFKLSTEFARLDHGNDENSQG